MSKLVDLHTHLGSCVPVETMWSIARKTGFKPTNKIRFEEFSRMLTKSNTGNLDSYLSMLHNVTEKIQSWPDAIEQCVYATMSHEYRINQLDYIEIRFNPMKRNMGGTIDLDRIILSAINGMNTAKSEYSIDGSIILCLGRDLTYDQNRVIVDKAIKFSGVGVSGIDLAGPETPDLIERGNGLDRYKKLFASAVAAGLKATCHIGETPKSTAVDVISAVDNFHLSRIGHGIAAARSPSALKTIHGINPNIVFELCLTSNKNTGILDTREEAVAIQHNILNSGLKYVLCTDGGVYNSTNVKNEIFLWSTGSHDDGWEHTF